MRDADGVWDPGSGQTLLDFGGVRDVAEISRLPTLDDPMVEAKRVESTDPRRAEALYRRALERDAANAEAMIELGRLRHEAGDPEDAGRWYARAAAVACTDLQATAQFNLGVALQDAGNRAGALAAYREALRLDPSCADAHYNAARLCELAGDQIGALRHLRAYARFGGPRRT